jgi:hypothetical protein
MGISQKGVLTMKHVKALSKEKLPAFAGVPLKPAKKAG